MAGGLQKTRFLGETDCFKQANRLAKKRERILGGKVALGGRAELTKSTHNSQLRIVRAKQSYFDFFAFTTSALSPFSKFCFGSCFGSCFATSFIASAALPIFMLKSAISCFIPSNS